jgi:hypothetical protein
MVDMLTPYQQRFYTIICKKWDKRYSLAAVNDAIQKGGGKNKVNMNFLYDSSLRRPSCMNSRITISLRIQTSLVSLPSFPLSMLVSELALVIFCWIFANRVTPVKGMYIKGA